jgi:GNAT superfamily N-acetyltransferase
MPPITRDVDAWLSAGGERRAIDVLSRVGRMATFTDGEQRCLAGVHPERPEQGTVADWTGSPQVLDAALDWLRDQGCADVVGPMYLCRWFPYRANQGPHGPAPLLYEAPARAEPWEAAGFEVRDRYVSVLCQHARQIDAGTGAAARLAMRGWRLSALGTTGEPLTGDAFDRALAHILAVAEQAFVPVDGFVSVPSAAVRDWYRPLRHAIDPRLVFLVHDPAGQPAGFLLSLPDGLAPERRWFQLVTLGVLPRHQGSGVGAWMVAAAHRAAERMGLSAGVHGPIHVQGDRLEDTTWFHGELVRRYALYGRRL